MKTTIEKLRIRYFAIAFIFTLPAYGAVIVQKNGDVISGNLLQETDNKYIFQSPYGKLQIAKTNVEKFIRDEKVIELKNIIDGGKTVKARLIDKSKSTSVYLTDDGRTIRKNVTESEAKSAAQVKSPSDRVLLSIMGSYGFSTFPQSGSADTPPGVFDQALHANTIGGHLAGHYVFSRYFGVGIAGSYYRWAGTESIMAKLPQISYDSHTIQTSIMAAPSAVISLLGCLGSTQSSHDLRLSVQVGAAFNSITTHLVFTNAVGFPPSADASGTNISPALQAQLYYAYSISPSVRATFGLGYYRAFYSQIYSGTLASNGGPIPGAPAGFKGDFEAGITSKMTNPQVISIYLGLETGF